ncbi:hypothetical protein NPIL_297901 [Nephila pilipes]|uniref:Uncharacterized protein n=1 Tax=Nephila pilipes TaxID=299642 RepID=A0A8X6QJW4_NEPPI|nr:hypothetical protein NPIL_297901 [Nephila pilipes]
MVSSGADGVHGRVVGNRANGQSDVRGRSVIMFNANSGLDKNGNRIRAIAVIFRMDPMMMMGLMALPIPK